MGITILKNAAWTAEDERHLKYVDPEEMKLVMAENQAQQQESKWGESKQVNISRMANIPLSMYTIPHYRKYFHCGNSEKLKEMREILLKRFENLRASKKR